MEQQCITGTTTGTGASLNVTLGFTPSRVELWNSTSCTKLIWTSDMTDAYARKEHPFQQGLLTSPRPARATTADQVYNAAFSYLLNGRVYDKTATAAGTAPTATTIPINKYGAFGFEIGTDGVIGAGKDAANNATGYATEALAITAVRAALASPTASHVAIMYVTVINTATTFVGATTNFNATGVTANFYAYDLVNYITSLGVTPIADGDSTTINGGFTIGADTDLNVSGDTIYYTAWR